MYGDFSRVLDGLAGRYSAVLAQQGRFLLDAELNEQTSILLDYMRRLTTDLVGPFAGPLHHCGFEAEPVRHEEKYRAVRLSRGPYYVYGLRCESPPPHVPAHAELSIGEHEAPFIVYIVVWEQSISSIQDPSLVDPGLGSGVVDTSRRSQVRWIVAAARRLPGEHRDLTELGHEEIVHAFHEYNANRGRRPALGARAHSSSDPEPSPDVAPTAGGYRGVENQLYRVEVHRGGDTDDATFKWSRDNGSVEFALDSLGERDQDGIRTATLARVWYDARQGLEVGDWVELVDDRWEPLGTPPPLLQVRGVSPATRGVKLFDTDANRSFDSDRHPFLRRWDQAPESQAAGHGIPVTEADGRWYVLEDGVQVRFEAQGARYERGDFWLIPARSAIADVIWPRSQDSPPAPLAMPPAGPARYFVPLAHQSHHELHDLRIRFAHQVDWDWDTAPRTESGDSETRTTAMESETQPLAIRTPAVSYLVRSISDFEAGAVFRVNHGTTLGRDAYMGIRFNHPDVSRHHAEFALVDDQLTVMDLGSTNGTLVNGQQLAEREPMPLAPGDTIQFGTPEVQVVVEEE